MPANTTATTATTATDTGTGGSPQVPVPAIAHTHSESCQTFRFTAFQWCVTQLAALLDAEPRLADTVEDVDITSLDAWLGLDEPEPGRVSLIRIDVDREYAMTTDLSKPPLLVRLVAEDGRDYGNVFVDGWHRLYRARAESRTSLTVLHVQAHAARAALMPIYLR